MAAAAAAATAKPNNLYTIKEIYNNDKIISSHSHTKHENKTLVEWIDDDKIMQGKFCFVYHVHVCLLACLFVCVLVKIVR